MNDPIKPSRNVGVVTPAKPTRDSPNKGRGPAPQGKARGRGPAPPRGRVDEYA